MNNNNKYPKQRIPQDLLTNLAISAKGPLLDILKEVEYTMPARTDAPFYDPGYISGQDSSSSHYAVDKLIKDFKNEDIIAYLSDLADAPQIIRGQYKESIHPEDPDTAFVYHHKNYPSTTVPERALRTLMHEGFLHGTGGRHEGLDLDTKELFIQMHPPGSSQENYPMYGTQEEYDVMELNLLEELKDVAFLSQQELVQLPKWMLKTLNVRIEDAPDVPESGEAVAEESSTTSF